MSILSNFLDYFTGSIQYECLIGDLKGVKFFVSKGCNVNKKGKYGRTPIMIAAHAEYSEIVQFLIDHGADLTSQDEDGKTILHLLFSKEDPSLEVIKILLDTDGIDFNQPDNDGKSFLHYYVSRWSRAHGEAHKMADILDLLATSNKVDFNFKDNLGRAPLHYAINNQCKFILQKMLDLGCNPDIQDNDGDTVMHLLIKNQHRSEHTRDLLLKYKPNLSLRNNAGKIPYHVARRLWGVEEYNKETLAKLIPKGFDTDKLNLDKLNGSDRDKMYDHEVYWENEESYCRAGICPECGKDVAVKEIRTGTSLVYRGDMYFQCGVVQRTPNYSYKFMPHYKPCTKEECWKGKS